MINSVATAPPVIHCWNTIGVQGDGSCPELLNVIHCHNCPVFMAAARRLLDLPAPAGYLTGETERLAARPDAAVADLASVLVFRVGDEWLALPVQSLIEVSAVRPVHSVPYRGGLIAGLVNIRGELQLCIRLDQLLGIAAGSELPVAGSALNAEGLSGAGGTSAAARFLVVQRETERWIFPVDEVDQVRRFSVNELSGIPSTLARSSARLSRGVVRLEDRTIGLLDDLRLFHALQTRLAG